MKGDGSIWNIPLAPPPDLGLPPAHAAQVDIAIKQFVYRWAWRASDQAGMRADLYRILQWVQGEDPPPDTLTDPREALPHA